MAATQNSSSDLPLLLTVQQTAALLQLGRNTVYELIAQRRLPSVRVGRCVRVPREALEEWVRREELRKRP